MVDYEGCVLPLVTNCILLAKTRNTKLHTIMDKDKVYYQWTGIFETLDGFGKMGKGVTST